VLSPTAQDLAGTNKLLFTQEFLGEMLGVRRTSVTEVAVVLQGRGLIHYHRVKTEITNLDGLRKASCECYSAVRSHYELLIGTTYEDAQMR